MATARAAMDGPIQTGLPKKDQEVDALFRTAKVLLRACRLQHQGAVIDLRSEGKVEPNALAAFFQELTPF
jgi:calcineurin-like phosphoesterase